MKICKDCEYYYGYLAACNAPENGQSLVTGDNNFAPASENRDNDLKCGLTGEWFVQKKIEEPKQKHWWKFWS